MMRFGRHVCKEECPALCNISGASSARRVITRLAAEYYQPLSLCFEAAILLIRYRFFIAPRRLA